MTEYTNDFSLAFKQGTVLEFPAYSIAVPDGFEAKTNVDGRDFVIYKRFDFDVEDHIRDEELLYTEIKLSHTPEEAGLLIEGDSTSNYTANIIEAMLFPFGGRGGSLRRFKTDVSVGFIEPWDTSFYITIVLNKHIFRMWLLVQDPAYFDDTEREFPEFSEKNLKDIEKMVKKWVSTIRSKESTEDDAPPQVNMERVRELEATLGDTISRALRKEAEEAMRNAPAVVEILQGIDATHMRGVRGLSNRIDTAARERKTLHRIGTDIDTDKSWIGVHGYAQSVRINRGATSYGICGALGNRTKYVLEELIKQTEMLTEDEVYLNLLEEVDFNRQQGYEISVEGVRGAIFARRETPIWMDPPGEGKEGSSEQDTAAEQAAAPKPSATKASTPKASAPAAVRRSKAGAQTRAASTSYSDDRIAANVKSEAASAKQLLDDFAQRLEQSDVMQQSSMDGALRRIKSLPDMAPALKQITVNVLYSEHRVDIIYTTGKICGIDKELSYSVSVSFSGFAADPKIFARELVESLQAESAEGLLGIFAEQTEQAVGYALPQLRPHEEFAERRAALQEKGPKQCREWAVLSDDERDALLRQEALEAKELFAVFADAVQQSDVMQQRSMDGALRRLTSLAEDGELFPQLSVQIHYSEHMIEVTYLSDGIVRGDKAVTCSVSASFEDYSAEPKAMVKSLAEALYAAAPETLYQQMTDLSRPSPTLTPAQKQAAQEEPQRDIQEMRRKIMQERDEELAAWKKACDDAADRRAAGERLRRAELDDALKEQKKQLEESHAAAAAALTEQMDTIKQKLAAQNNELASLKWLDFSGKSRLKKAIADGERRVAALEKERADGEARYAAEVQHAEEEHAQAVRQIGLEMKEKYPAPKDTEKAITKRAKKRLIGCALQLQETGSLDEASIDALAKTSIVAQMVKVVDFLDSHKEECFTCSDLIMEGLFPKGTLSQQSADICNKLVKAECIEKGVLKGKTVYMANGTFKLIEGVKPSRNK